MPEEPPVHIEPQKLSSINQVTTTQQSVEQNLPQPPSFLHETEASDTDKKIEEIRHSLTIAPNAVGESDSEGSSEKTSSTVDKSDTTDQTNIPPEGFEEREKQKQRFLEILRERELPL